MGQNSRHWFESPPEMPHSPLYSAANCISESADMKSITGGANTMSRGSGARNRILNTL